MDILKKILKTLYFKYFYNTKETQIICYNDYIGKHILFDNFYEKEDLTLLKNSFSNNIKKSSFIDIGSNIGNHSIFFRNNFKNIYCFEPQRITYKILQLNTEKFNNIKIYNYGIDIKHKETTFYIPIHNNGMVKKNKIEGEIIREERVILKPIDNLLIKNVGFIKIDVEGNEFNVLKSLIKILKSDKPILGFELNLNNKNKDKLFHFLYKNNYHTFFVNNKYLKGGPQRYFDNLWQKNKLVKVEIQTLKKLETDISMVITVNNNSKYNLNFN